MSDQDKVTVPIHFYDYDKISDTLMYFSNDVTLKFNVVLAKKTSGGSRKFFSREVVYNNKNYNGNDLVGSVKRDLNFYYSIEIYQDFKSSVVLRPNDVALLQMVLNRSILPWYVGNKRIFGLSPENKMSIRGKWSEIKFNLSDYKYMSFLPIVFGYGDETDAEGIRIVLNSPSTFVDTDINSFMKFYYIICNTDMYACANSMINYLTAQESQGINQYQFDGSRSSIKDYYQDDYDFEKESGHKPQQSFFDKK